ncbi:radical SAM family heme chaperone HemW [Salirhabdus salicampi]|uniref:radical SAM family heme chaperone HemW n=1 Tax=Salirhabdus salicampi TaxID=476102 RepID=UPI0020C1D50C|nr:radical SAM family heme chaperone HemW [Salirhabdus salicampi]MCP8616917.1 radical SAM family heme chaperone HemW [Salirhabdus salicampi]
MKQVESVYIHIPFCHEICYYCDFTKIYYNSALAEQYLEALEQEIRLYVGDTKQTVRTIYIGGGTPTSLNDEQFRKLLKTVQTYFNVEQCEEYTVEANPGEFSVEKMGMLNEYGVDRISLGVQVLDDQFLQMLNRNHRVKDVHHTVEQLQRANLTNISMDFIYGLPDQTMAQFEKTLDDAIAFHLPHYSAYSLQIEPKTVFYLRYQKGKLQKPPEEEEAQMYHTLKRKMENNGLYQYEISNFAKQGYESKHNLTYWDNAYYYGFGAGAHGYLPGRRIVNVRPVKHYIQEVKQGKKPALHEEIVTKKEKIEEEMFLGLRKAQGVSKVRFHKKYKMSIHDVFGEDIQVLKEKGWIEEEGDWIRLTNDGRLFGNEAFSHFLLDENISFQ